MRVIKRRIPWNKGIPCSEKTKRKISEALKGERNPNYGKHHSEESKRKMSEAKKGHLTSKETRRKLSEAKKGEKNPCYGKPRSVETRRRISEATKGKYRSVEAKRNISKSKKGENHPNYGKPRSVETRKRISEANKGKHYHSLEVRRRMSEALKGEKNPSWLGGISFEPYGIEFNEELRQSIRERDNFTCQICNIKQENLKQGLCTHHIDYKKTNNNPTNLVALCNNCHLKTNFNRKYWTQFFTKRNEPTFLRKKLWKSKLQVNLRVQSIELSRR